MELKLRSTDRFTEVNGVPARIWEGKTARGVKVFALITRVGVKAEDDCEEFEQELLEVSPPCSPEVARAILSALIV